MNFSKLVELQKAKRKYSNNRGYATKEEYVKAVNEVFNLNATVKDIHKTF